MNRNKFVTAIAELLSPSQEAAQTIATHLRISFYDSLLARQMDVPTVPARQHLYAYL